MGSASEHRRTVGREGQEQKQKTRESSPTVGCTAPDMQVLALRPELVTPPPERKEEKWPLGDRAAHMMVLGADRGLQTGGSVDFHSLLPLSKKSDTHFIFLPWSW